MKQLVALAVEGNSFVDALRHCWDAGHAVTPIDTRLPIDFQRQQLKRLGPDLIFEPGAKAPRPYQGLVHPVRLEDNDILVIETSGTTGFPKQVVHTTASLTASAKATNFAIEAGPQDRWLACLPLAHIGGLSVVMRAVLGDIPVTVTDRATPEVITAGAKNGATLVSVVTRLLNQIDASSFKAILLGGGTVPPDLPNNVIATYGMTETGSGIYYKDRLIDKAELKIVDEQIFVRGPMLLRGYRHLDAVEDPRDEDNWFATGDSGKLTDGKLDVFGRSKFVIRSGGEDIWPEQLEEQLETHPNILKAGVIGVASNEWGQKAVAYLTAAKGAPQTSSDEIKELISSNLPAWYMPKEIIWTDNMPMTNSGKINRSALRELSQNLVD